MDERILRKSLVARSDAALDAAVEDALCSMPLEPAPVQLFTNVMHEVQVMQARAVAAQRQAVGARELSAGVAPQPRTGKTNPVYSTTRNIQPNFRPSWVDLALSLFGALMLALGWLFLVRLPEPWGDYLRLQVLWSLQRLWYLNGDLLLWCCLAVVGLAGGIVAGILGCARLGICSRATP
jgi:hypothetical protein